MQKGLQMKNYTWLLRAKVHDTNTAAHVKFRTRFTAEFHNFGLKSRAETHQKSTFLPGFEAPTEPTVTYTLWNLYIEVLT